MNPQKLRSAKPKSRPLVAHGLRGYIPRPRVGTVTIYNSWAMGESYESISKRLGLTMMQVIAAVHYELGRASRNSPLYWEEIMSEEYWE